MENVNEQAWSDGLYWPVAGGTERAPVVILLPAIAAINDYIRGVGARLNARGYSVLAIDYFAKTTKPDLSSPEKILAAATNLPDPAVIESIRAGLSFLSQRQDVDAERIGALGFCIGGTYALLAGAQIDGIRALVDYYGRIKYSRITPNKPKSPIDLVPGLKVPLLCHYGSLDHFVPLDDALALESELKKSSAPHEIYYYHGAPHAFDEDFRPAYRPAAARDAWERTLAFLDWYVARRPRPSA